MANSPNYDIALFFGDKFLNCFPQAYRGMVCAVSLVKIVSARYRHGNEATIIYSNAMLPALPPGLSQLFGACSMKTGNQAAQLLYDNFMASQKGTAICKST